MNSTEAYNIALAAHTSYQVRKAGNSSDVYNYLEGEDLSAYEKLTDAQKEKIQNFSIQNAALFDSFPSTFEHDEDIEQREETIDAIKEKLDATFLFIR